MAHDLVPESRRSIRRHDGSAARAASFDHLVSAGARGLASEAAGQGDGELGELAGHTLGFDQAAVLLYDDVVAEGEPEAGTLARRLGSEERVEHLRLDVLGDTDPVIA